jgi:hypothetical protein
MVGAGVPLVTALLPVLGTTELTGAATLLYVAGNTFMLLGLIGIYAYQHEVCGVVGFVGFLVAVVGISVMGISGEIAGVESFIVGGGILALGLILLAIGLWIGGEFPRWVPALLILSVVVGIPGVAIEALADILYLGGSVLFAAGFGGAGYILWSRTAEPVMGEEAAT